MQTLWFCVVSAMLAIYAILDGFDLGAGIIHLFLARSERDRRSVLSAAGRFWDGNEVWLLLAGFALYCAFPAVYESRRFYISAIVLVWLLIIRGFATEFRGRMKSLRTRRSLDVIFGVTGILLAFALGVAVGCLIRNVPPAGAPLVFDGFTISCGVSAIAVLTLQSAAWMALKTEGELPLRCRRLASAIWWTVLVSYAGVTAAAFNAQPHVVENLAANSWTGIFAVIAVAGLIGTRLCLNIGFDLGVFAGASCVIAGLLTGTAAGQFPYLLAPSGAGLPVLTVHNATAASGIAVSVFWWIPAFSLAVGYNLFMHRLARHRVEVKSGITAVHAHPI